MTPTEFAEAHGLSLEEATFILSRRAALASVDLVAESTDRVSRARSILALAQKRVGVHPVTEELEKVYDPDADVGAATFYKKHVSEEPRIRSSVIQGTWVETVDDWEEPP